MDVKGKIEQLKEQLQDERVETSAGGGMVNVVMTGRFEVESIKIDPEIINREDPEVLETMVKAAVNDATRRVQEMVKAKMKELTGGIDIPGIS
jgi:DNA-binding YbaB/EbfC family protein